MKTPQELGLPPKFREFRPHQVEALERIARSKEKVVLLQAPTGSGKTLIMAALGRFLKTSFLYTCHTKQLQAQVVEDYPYAVEVKGRGNYPCLKSPTLLTANECTREKDRAQGGDCPHVAGCPYLVQKALARSAEVAILNIPYFLGEANFAGDFSGWPWVVLDEGDQTEQALMSFIQVEFTEHLIESLGLPPPSKKTVAEAWYQWAKEMAYPAIRDRIALLDKGDVQGGLKERRQELPQDTQLGLFGVTPVPVHHPGPQAEGPNPRALKERAILDKQLRKVAFLLQQPLERWVFIGGEKSWTFKPIFVSRYAQHYLWRHGQRFLVMSGTILSPAQFARDLGLKAGEWAFIDIPSIFPAERRPVYFSPVANVTRNNQEVAWPGLVKALDGILAHHPGEKGLVHCVSYSLAEFVLAHSRHSLARLRRHDREDRGLVLKAFKESLQADVLVSPSMGRGVDLPYDLCRFVVVLKVPYPYLGDAQVSRRLHSSSDGPLWYALQAVRSIIQATGRGMRAEDDSCVCYILDAQFGRLYEEHRNLFPKWWRDAVRFGEIPSAPIHDLPPPRSEPEWQLVTWDEAIAIFRELHARFAGKEQHALLR